jgi:hypothetical protein
MREPEVCVTPRAVRTDAGRRPPESPQRVRSVSGATGRGMDASLSSEKCVRDRSSSWFGFSTFSLHVSSDNSIGSLTRWPYWWISCACACGFARSKSRVQRSSRWAAIKPDTTTNPETIPARLNTTCGNRRPRSSPGTVSMSLAVSGSLRMHVPQDTRDLDRLRACWHTNGTACCNRWRARGSLHRAAGCARRPRSDAEHLPDIE